MQHPKQEVPDLVKQWEPFHSGGEYRILSHIELVLYRMSRRYPKET